VQFSFAHAEDRAVQEYVLASAQLGMEAGAELEQRRDAPVHGHRALVWHEDPGQHLEHRALPGAVRADQPERGSGRHLERDVSERPELVEDVGPAAQHACFSVELRC
jgi:hypothetical protein